MIRIDPGFQALVPPLTAEELAQLETNILADGCRDPLVTWQGAIVDGHNRYAICTRHGIEFETVEMDFPSREAAEDWMDANQLGRRNLTKDQYTLLLGRRYNRTKKAAHRPAKGGQNEPLLPQKTAQKLANEYGVSPATVKRAGKYAEAVKTIQEEAPELAEVIRQEKPTRDEVICAAEVVRDEPEKAQEIIVKKPHVAHNSGENEWYTPPQFIEAARETMGSIDCDPASSEIANETVSAGIFYSKDDDGLTKPWPGNVWMNPPYAQPLIAHFCSALAERISADDEKQACVLVNNATDTAWFHGLLAGCSALCLVKGRVKFLDPAGNPGAPLQGQAVVYFGKRWARFGEMFKQFGEVFYR